MAHFSLGDPGYTHSLRLTFAYEGREVRLERVERRRMRSLAPSTPPPEPGQVGSWLELRDAGGALVYHRALHDPLRETIELHGREPGVAPRRVPNPVRAGRFQVVVPDMAAAHVLVLFGPPGEATDVDASVPLARHELAELRRRDVNRLREAGETDEQAP